MKKNYNLYERNLYKYAMMKLHPPVNKSEGSYPKAYKSKLLEIIVIWIAEMFVLINSKITKGLYIRYVEMPITTRCTMRCKECCNFIQYYERSYDLNFETIKTQIGRLVEASDGIKKLRILGGEPLLHPELNKILDYCIGVAKIEWIEIVTNGTIIPDKEVFECLKDSKCSLYISNYGAMSTKKETLCKELINYRIPFRMEKDNAWWAPLGGISSFGRTKEELVELKRKCLTDCISLFNGKLYICPKAAHGDDLGIFSLQDSEYVVLEDDYRINRSNIYKLLNIGYITACDYCNMPFWNDLEKIKPAEQIKIKDAMAIISAAKDKR